MLFSYNDLRKFAIEAKDGRKGRAKDLYFDDETWRVLYAVTASGFHFNRQEGLIKSTLLGVPDVETQTLPISLTKEQLDDAENPEAHAPVSAQRERDIRQRQFEFWPTLMMGAPGAAYTPMLAERQLLAGGEYVERDLARAPEPVDDPHLRSLEEVWGYGIEARDGALGSISDFLLDPDGWRIRYIVVDTGSWLPGRQVAIRPDWVSDVSWEGQSVAVRANRQELSDAPEVSKIEELERSDAHLAVAPYGAYAGFGP